MGRVGISLPAVTPLQAQMELTDEKEPANILPERSTSSGNSLQPFQLKRVTAQTNTTTAITPFRNTQSIERKNDTGLPDNLKAGVENLSGYSMDDVKVYYNSSRPAQLQAFAYAQGTDIHVGPSQEKHLPHEAWHVVQQKQHRATPTQTIIQKKAALINDDTGLEQEADIMGAKALQMKDANPAGGTLIESGSLSLVPKNNATVQRKLGLELEVAVPIDRMGVLSGDDEKILKGKKNDDARLKQLFATADAGYGEFGSVGNVALHADHSSRVLPPGGQKPPYRVMGRSILEMVFKPAVETQAELDERMKEVDAIVKKIDSSTENLSKRKGLMDGVSVGPVDGDSAPKELNWSASIHVNVGIDPRRLHGMLSWYAGSAYKPSREVKLVPIDKARDLADGIVKAFSERSEVSNEDAQYWNGLRGLTMIFVMYLLNGADKSNLKSTVKNFATLLSKTRFSSIIQHSMTPREKEWLEHAWEGYKKSLIKLTRPGEDEDSPLILRTNERDELKDASWKIGHLFRPGLPILVDEKKEIAADDVGAVRSNQDKVAGGKRRKGVVLEFRSLPGPYEPGQWAGIAKGFLAQANIENSVEDYKELPPPKVPEAKKKEKDVLPDVKEIKNLPLVLPDLPAVVSGKKEDIVVEQTAEFWVFNQEVKWKGDIWKVIKKEGIKKYTLSFIKKA